MASYRTNRFSKCPECGFDLYNRGNKMGKEMSEMLRSRSKYTRNKINHIATLINDLIPSQNRTEYWKFLVGIKKIDDKIIDYGIEKYYQGGHHNQGKGFPYLKKILQTLGQDNEAIKELERIRIGGVPPIIKIEERQ